MQAALRESTRAFVRRRLTMPHRRSVSVWFVCLFVWSLGCLGLGSFSHPLTPVCACLTTQVQTCVGDIAAAAASLLPPLPLLLPPLMLMLFFAAATAAAAVAAAAAAAAVDDDQCHCYK